MSQGGQNAVVCGASMAGLLAARVLSDFYGSITLVERDVLPEKVIQRRGVPQGKHLHQLLSRGSSVLGELFPGLFDDLVAAGANVIDDPAMVYMRVGEHVLAQHGEFANPEALVVYSVSRPLLEAHVRRRVQGIENVTFLEGHDVVEPIVGHADRVTAVQVVSRETRQERVLDADLVVDATGRSARTPAFLKARGYRRPAEQSYSVNLNYAVTPIQITLFPRQTPHPETHVGNSLVHSKTGYRAPMVLSVKCVAPSGSTEPTRWTRNRSAPRYFAPGGVTAKSFAAARGGARGPSRSASATIAGSAARLWPRARLESRDSRVIRSSLAADGLTQPDRPQPVRLGARLAGSTKERSFL